MYRTALVSIALASLAGCVGSPNQAEGTVTEASHFNPGGPGAGRQIPLCAGPMWTFYWPNNFVGTYDEKKPGAIFNPSQYDSFCGGYQFDIDGVYGQDLLFFDIEDVDAPITNPLYCASYQLTWSALGHNARTDKWIPIPGVSGSLSANNNPYSPLCTSDIQNDHSDVRLGSLYLVHLIPYDKIRVTVDAHVLAADGTVIPRWINFYGVPGIRGGGIDGSGEYPTQ